MQKGVQCSLNINELGLLDRVESFRHCVCVCFTSVCFVTSEMNGKCGLKLDVIGIPFEIRIEDPRSQDIYSGQSPRIRHFHIATPRK